MLSPLTHAASAATQLQEVVLTSVFLEREVQVSILLPPAATNVPAAGYPVLYLNDGQDLLQLQLQATIDQLFAHATVQPFVLVAPHANEDRVQEYGVAAQADYKGRGSRAGAYTDFVLQELVPFAQENYKVSASAADAVFAGFSLGGLAAFDIVWHHPDVFARAGVFSGSFWWRSRALDDGYTPADRIMQSQVRAGQPHPTHRFWLQTGTLDERGDRNENGVIDSIEDCLDLLQELVNSGLNVQQSVRYVQVEGGHHHPSTWGQVMPDFLQWAFGQAAAPPLPAPLPVVRLALAPAALVAAPAEAVVTDEEVVASIVEEEDSMLVSEQPDADLPFEATAPNAKLAQAHQPIIGRPELGDHTDYHEKYIDLIPVGTSPLQALRDQDQEVQLVFGQLSEKQAMLAYAPGKWTAKEMLLHMIDTERIFAYRALRFARGDAQELAGFDENGYAANSGANDRTMSSLLAEYQATRAATRALFNSFTEVQLRQRGTANNASVTVLALLYILPGHERHHLNVFAERYQPLL